MNRSGFRQWNQPTRSRGFTVVELVTVMVVLSILAIGTTRFINSATVGYVSTNNRADMVSSMQTTLLALVRDVRNSLPRSIRVSADGACLEFIPIEQGTRYTSAPIGSASASLSVAPVPGFSPSPGLRIAMQSDEAAYSLANPGSVSSALATATAGGSGELNLTLSSAHQFPSGSAGQRLYYVAQPVSYCVDSARFWRYQDYGFLAAQPGLASLPTALPNRVLVAESVASVLPVFSYTNPSLERNGSLSVNLIVTKDGEQIALDQLIAIRNVP